MSLKKIILYFAGFIYLVLTVAFWLGLVASFNHLPADPVLTDRDIACFGIGLCALPALSLAAGFIGFYCELAKELKSLESEEKKKAADKEKTGH